MKSKPLPTFTRKDETRFWHRVFCKGPDECWPWIGSRLKDGYGKFAMNGGWILANRAAYFFSNEIDPQEHMVCHSCNNPPCCNPAHLFAGTNQENVSQMWQERRREPKLRADDILVIRERLLRGDSMKAIGFDYGVNSVTIFKIKWREIWNHV